jgi:hypothetical protein
MDWDLHRLLVIAPGMLLLCSGAYALYWAVCAGRSRDFTRGARAVFTEEEPEGLVLEDFSKAAPAGANETSSAKAPGRDAD